MNYKISKTPFINDYSSYNTYTNYSPSSIYNKNDLNNNDLNNQITSLRNKYMSNMFNTNYNNDNYRDKIIQLNDFPINDPINNVNPFNNNKYLNSNYLNEMSKQNTYYNSTNYDSNPFLYKEKDYNNYINKRSETPKNNNLYKGYNYKNNSNYQDLIRNNIVSKTEELLNIPNIQNLNNPLLNNQSIIKKNYSSNNIYNFNKYNTIVNNNSFQLINNNNNNKNEKNSNINTIKIKPNIDNKEDAKINKKYYRSYTSEFHKKLNPIIKKKFLENMSEEENEKCSTNPLNRIKIKNLKNKKDVIIRPYKYISEKMNNVNNNVIKKISKKKIDKIDNPKNNINQRKINSPPKTFYIDLKNKTNKNFIKNKSISKIKNPYFYNTYQIGSNNKRKNNKTNLFKYSSIMSDLLNKNSKNFFKI